MAKLFLSLVLFLALAVPGLAEVHYVTQSGAGSHNGSSLANAWSVAEFNDTSPSKWSSAANTEDNLIGPGDTVYFSGTITSKVFPVGAGTAANPITLDGYEGGNNDYTATTGSGALITRSNQADNVYCMELSSANQYLIIQDFEMSEAGEGIAAANAGYIKVYRCIIHDMWNRGFLISTGCNNWTIGGSLGNGCHVFDCGTDSSGGDVATQTASYLVITHNILGPGGNNGSDHGIDGVVMNYDTHHVLISNNNIGGHGSVVENCVDAKTRCHDIVVSYNYMHDETHNEPAIAIHMNAYNIYVYCNYIYNNAAGMLVYNNAQYDATYPMSHNIHIWSNVWEANVAYGLRFIESPDEMATTNQIYELYIYNNTFYNNATTPSGSQYSAIFWQPGNLSGSGQNLKLSNNIFQQNRPNGTAGLYEQECFDNNCIGAWNADASCVNSHNIYYHSANDNCFRWYYGVSSAYDWTLAEAQAGTDNSLFDNCVFGSPGMQNPASHQFWPASGSSAIVGAGTEPSGSALPGTLYFLQDNSVSVNLSNYRTGLDSTTNWTTSVPTIVTRQFNPAAWDMGAFPYSASPSSMPLYRKIHGLWDDLSGGL